ncbi:TIGR03032 family protein [Magnetovirga frankeli]|uniref:TIGR03032 family protein n=1 Tax=Magnetovirga frankeli TaxID=947516 RepID=UPI001293B910|nr:TIGR03032 family protein [gamma proteobacterium SS-5]
MSQISVASARYPESLGPGEGKAAHAGHKTGSDFSPTTAPQGNHQPPALNIQADPGLWHWLAAQNISLALTTYQSNRLFLIGRKDEPGRLAVQERLFDKPMGLHWQAETDTLTLGCRYQLWQLANRLPAGQSHEGGDRLYVPRQSWITGDINAHDVAIDREGRLLFVNTDFSCLASLNPDYSFAPIWQPPFISKLVAEDRCHLNGLALQEGEPTWMTACSATDEAAGWRNHRQDGGVVLHIPSNQIVATGLSMPHSPRWYQGKLWLLNSGSGEFGYLDNERFVPVTYAPGFVRGLAFHGDYAIVGLSQLRSTSFGGLSLEQRLAADQQTAQCGLVVIDLNSGQIVHWLQFASLVEELFDLVVIPGTRQPRALGLQDDAIERLVSFPGSNGLVITKPSVHRPGQTPVPVAGLPRPEPAVDSAAPSLLYQRVYHLTPGNLKPYAALLQPGLLQGWASQPPQGELFGLSAAVDGALVGLAIAERTPDGAQLRSLAVLPQWQAQGVAERLLHELQKSMGIPVQSVQLSED